jgi:uncharacterized protein YodC (DUF2158 family)
MCDLYSELKSGLKRAKKIELPVAHRFCGGTEMTEKFPIGTIVQLKSGGPKMTVQDLRHASPLGLYACTWFAGARLEHGSFREETLQLYTEEKKDKAK